MVYTSGIRRNSKTSKPFTTTISLMHILHLAVAFSLLATTSFLVAQAVDEEIKCSVKEKQALLKIKDDLIDSDGILASWVSEESYQKNNCCQWRRVDCSNSTGHVIGLNLSSLDSVYGYTGKISPSVSELENLEVLDLSSNNFNGSDIPECIASLTNLTYLNLQEANFSGRFSSRFQNLTNLQYLNLRGNYDLDVENLYQWLPHLSSLRILDLSGINLSTSGHGWQHTMNKLHSLESLSLSSCDLHDDHSQPVPRENSSSQDFVVVYGHSSLTYIDLSFNNLSSSIFKWLMVIADKVTYLDLSNNPLRSSIPDGFGNQLPSLTSVNLSNCQLKGGVPKSIGKICTLRDLVADRNTITGELSELVGNLSGCAGKSLMNLILGDNMLTGSNFSLGNQQFKKLRMLNLGGNKLNGRFPSARELSKLFELENLNLSSNSLKCVVTEAHLTNLTRLKHLDLSYNTNLSFSVNSNWVPPFQLYVLKASSCRIGPTFPNWIQNQRNVTSLDISSCGISGSIPLWFWDVFPTVEFLNFSSNQLRGRLPMQMKRAYNELRSLDFSSNYFEGPLQSFLLPSEVLNLAKNRFSGSLSSLCKNEFIFFVDLSENLFSGDIPDCLTYLSFLEVLHLRNNSLSGKIPNTIGSISELRSLDLSNNNLSGTLPSSMKNCKSLAFLDVGENRLSGEIPVWIGELLFLNVLILKHNHFSGSIPPKFCNLQKIVILDISMNSISGNIPDCLSNFTAMARNDADNGYHPEFGFTNKTTQGYDLSYNLDYYDSAMISWQGRDYVYRRSLGILHVINLSNNKMTGKIPSSLANLSSLRGLNLSCNYFWGSIPHNMGVLKELILLDLSKNNLSGEIPSSISNLSFLSYMNLSYNHFSGRIPLSTQIQGLDPSAFAGNLALCGPPLTPECASNQTQPSGRHDTTDADEEDELKNWLFGGIGCGFFVGFCGICFFLTFHDFGHGSISAMVESMDWFYVTVLVQLKRLRTRVAVFRIFLHRNRL